MKSAYYNEIDPHAAAWLRGLISAGLIAPGEVDERSITDVRADDVRGFTQCHFFAGIGGWSYALRLAGWPDDRPVWTGSCPCQPYSAAGKGLGDADARNLWPAFFRLIKECRPDSVIGEQVEGAVRHGWLDGISRDLEGEGYAVGAAVLGAHSAGAPHIRQRLYWLADAECGAAKRQRFNVAGETCRAQGEARQRQRVRADARAGIDTGGIPDAVCERLAAITEVKARIDTDDGENFWSDSYWHLCRDGKHRRVPFESAFQPLAARLPGRVGLLRGAGNAIVPALAAAFIAAFLET